MSFIKKNNHLLALGFLLSMGLGACSNNRSFSKPSPKLEPTPASSSLPLSFSPLADVQIPPGRPIHDLENTLILISIDGLRPDSINSKDAPNLTALAARGARANAMIPSFPTLTFPNHYSLVTGLRPENHGIIANEIRDPQIPERFTLGNREVANNPKWWLGEPLWVTAQKQGLRSGTMFWPGSEALIMGMRPTYFQPYDYNMPREARVAQVLEWLDFGRSSRPHFLTLYFEEVDSAGHKFGPHAPEVKAILKNVDSAVGLLMKGLEDRKIASLVNIIIVSDHGMAPIIEKQKIYVGDVLREFPGIETIGGGALLGVFSSDTQEQKKIEKRLKDFSTQYTVNLKTQMPARFHYRNSPRIPDILLLAKESAYITTSPTATIKGGTHGYDNQLASMRASFIAFGPAFNAGSKITAFQNVDVYSLMCKVLKLKPAKNDGSLKSLQSILKNP